MFSEENKFRDFDRPADLVNNFLQDGDVQNAIACLEADLIKNPENHQNWRILGQLLQENDEDEKAIVCLERAY